jgi:hypothetical protein
LAGPPNPNATTGHLGAAAIDAYWSGPLYESTGGVMNSWWQDECLVAQNFGTTGPSGVACTESLYESVYKFNEMTAKSGIKHISQEWWHHEPGACCGAGDYK